jgi:hypothetical protein
MTNDPLPLASTVWLTFFSDLTTAEIALHRAVNTLPFVDVDPEIAARLEAIADEVEAIRRAFLEGGKGG